MVASGQTELASWQVIQSASQIFKLQSNVELPELVQFAGFPTVIYFSFECYAESQVSDDKAPWSLTIDVSKFLDSAFLSPLRSLQTKYGTWFAGYISGVVRNVPSITLAIDVDGYFGSNKIPSDELGVLNSFVQATVEDVTIESVSDMVLSDKPAEAHRVITVGDGWTLISAPNT